MKLLHVINKLGGGGRERRMAQTAVTLNSLQNIDQAVVAYAGSDPYPELEKSGIPIYLITGKRIDRLKEYQKVIREFSPDIVHLWLETPTELLFFSMLKFFYHYKCIVGFIADGNSLRKITVHYLGIKCAFFLADVIISNSKAGLLAKNAPEKKSVVIYNGFDFNRFHRIDVKAKRKSLGVGDELLVVMCASITRAKDWMSFIMTAGQVKLKGLKALFLAVGGGSQLDEFRKYAKIKGIDNIQFTGRRNDVEEILQAADVSMLFTNNEAHSEGVSNSIMESMAAGLPVIATKGGGTEEIINNMKNGLIIEPRDVDAAVESILFLVNNPNKRKEIKENALATIKDKFCQSDKTQEYVSLYWKILKEK